MNVFRWLVFTVFVCAGPAHSHNNELHENTAPIVLAPGYEALSYKAPVPGTYELPPIQPAANGAVLRSSGDDAQLHSLFENKIVVLSFIYRACDDINGCPLATFVMQQLKSELEQNEQLAEKVKLVSLSFDPANDTPEEMRKYRDSFGNGAVDWEFITTRSDEQLFPILEEYQQPISKVSREEGGTTINHMLRVFLIDSRRFVRNIYSVSLLHTDTLLSDIKTLVAENQQDAQIARRNTPSINYAESREGYANGVYRSQSTSLEVNGIQMNLLEEASGGALGLPKLQSLAHYTSEQVQLGRKLFFDRRLSHNNTISCAMCHVPQQGFTSNELSTAVGMEGRTVRRNTPTLFNVAYYDHFFHDARETSLENQIWLPLLAHNEMANPSVGQVLKKVAAIPEYREGLQTIYGSAKPSMQQIGELFAAYQSTLISANSRFDQWKFGGKQDALSSLEKQGYELFSTKAGCIACHTIEPDHALFTDQRVHNTGVGFQRAHNNNNKPRPVTLAPGVVLNIDPSVYAAAAEQPQPDTGYYEITLDPDDRWKYRTPTLRNVSITAPYMHDGSLSSLTDVVEFYNQGGIDNPTHSSLIQPLGLDNNEVSALVAFLMSLTGDNVSHLIADAIAAPIGDTRASN